MRTHPRVDVRREGMLTLAAWRNTWPKVQDALATAAENDPRKDTRALAVRLRDKIKGAQAPASP
jgi:hypothetical protein